MKRIMIVVLVILTGLKTSMCAVDGDKIDMKVLYVGYSPDKPIPESLPLDDNKKEAYIRGRMASYENLLIAYFTDVKIIDTRDYKQEMSDKYDVTIFDGLPVPLVKDARVYNGRDLKEWTRAEYLTKDYDRASICIGDVSDKIGRSLGSKNDWLCLCLYADAHHVETAHTIFNQPIKVDLTFETKKTPSYIFKYPSGENVPKQIPMWRVLKKSYEETALPPGLVSRGGGYTDSPDAEYISSGVCVKDVGAVALGRHANFFHWGFNSSVDNMTEEAKKVFINTIVYMKKFNGHKPIAKKYNEKQKIREPYFAFKLRDVSLEKYKSFKKQWTSNNATLVKRHEELIQKQESGEKLSAPQKFFIKKKRGLPPTFEYYLEKKMGDDFKVFGVDIEGYKKHLVENSKYYYGYGEILDYTFEMDVDAKELGIANNDIKILKKCISMLKIGENAELAQRILERYTTEKFETTKEWNKWFKKNKSKLFFTESGGYKWLVNTLK